MSHCLRQQRGRQLVQRRPKQRKIFEPILVNIDRGNRLLEEVFLGFSNILYCLFVTCFLLQYLYKAHCIAKMLVIKRNLYTSTSKVEAQGAKYLVVKLSKYLRSKVLKVFPKHVPQTIVTHFVNLILVNLSINILLEIVYITSSNVNSKSSFVYIGFPVLFRLYYQSRYFKGFESKDKSFESGLGQRRFQVNLELRKNSCFLVL